MTPNHDSPASLDIPTAPLVRLRKAERELSAAQTRVHELEREQDLANAHALRLLTERDEYRAEANRLIKLIAEKDCAADDLRSEIYQCAMLIVGISNALAERKEELDKSITVSERAAQAMAGFVHVRWEDNNLESIERCAICGAALDPNERECPRCEADAAREEREWYRGAQGAL